LGHTEAGKEEMTPAALKNEKAHTCDVFNTTLPNHFKGKDCSLILTRHCLLCGGAMVIRIDAGIPEYGYFEVGSTSPSAKPFICKERHPDQKNCTHHWIMLAGSQESNVGLLADQRHWCSECGNYCELPRQKLPVKGYT
jgi:hypothetical protein